MNAKIKKPRLYSNKKEYLFIIIFILIFSKNSFYLWLQDDYMIGTFFKYSDIGVCLSLIFTVWIIVKYGLPKKNLINRYIYIFVIMVLVSAVTALGIFNQSFYRGILVQRVQLAYLVLFLPVKRLLDLQRIDKRDVIRLVYILATYELTICTIQYFYYIMSGNMFLVVNAGLRYGEIRFYFEPALLLMVVFRSFFSVLNNRRNRIFNIVFVVWVCFFIMYITKMRAMTLLLIASLALCLLIWNKQIFKKVFICMLILFIAISVMGKSKIIQDTLNTLTGKEIIDNTLDIRKNAREYYINQVKETPITGRGYPSISSATAYQAAGTQYNYKFVDNGIFGFIYSYGLVGIIWYSFFWVMLLRISWKIRKQNSSYFVYIIYYTIGFITDFAWFWSGCCSFTLMISMLVDDYQNQRLIK